MIMNVVKLLFGLFLVLLVGVGGILQDGWQGVGPCAVMGLIGGLGVQLIASAGTGFKGNPLPMGKGCGLAVAVMVLVIVAGPPLSRAYHKSQEATAFAKVKDSREVLEWKDYFKGNPLQFRNPEWEARYHLALATEARKAKNAGELREVLKKAHEHDKDPVWAPTAKEASDGLSELFASALKGLGRKGANAGLQKAFSQIIDDLSQHPDGKIYLAFDTKAVMKPPAGDAEALAQMRSAPEVKAAGKVPVIDPGDAFSHALDQKRREVLLKVLKESFAGVFPSGLLDIAVLGDKEDRKDKLIMEVRNITKRIPDYYMRTRNDKVIGLMFGLEVQWSFQLFDRAGKELYGGTTKSHPATEISFRLAEDDPAWMPYSILVGSTYYNFGRLLTQAFGLKPPPEKKSFDSGEV